jgi:DNA-directed RNA polymerase specialized sigma24 family protein
MTAVTMTELGGINDYEAFCARDAARLRRLLVAHFGVEVGVEAAADALAWAWEHWAQMSVVDNRVGYLYRVAQSKARRYRRWGRRPTFPPETGRPPRDPEPGLDKALRRLPADHRVAVLLVHAHGWTYAEVAEAQGVPVSTVRNHVHRGLLALRRHLGVSDEH